MAFDNTTTSDVHERRFTVAICGGGIAGLTLAAVIKQHDHDSNIDVRIYESASRISFVGAGVSTWQRTWQILERLGLDLSKKSLTPPRPGKHLALRLRKSDVPGGGYDFYDVVTPWGMSGLHRADLFDALLSSLPANYKIETSKRLVSCHASPASYHDTPILLHFADGTTGTADVVVGADGVKSRTRAQMFQDLADATSDPTWLRLKEPTWSGVVAFRSLIPTADLLQAYPDHPCTKNAVMHCGKHKSVIAYPVSAGAFVNVVAYVADPDKEGTPYSQSWETLSSAEEATGNYAGWEPQLLAITENMKKCSVWAIHVVHPLPRFVSGRIALIGDAAHASTPYVGAGAGEAMEDAYILGRLLAHRSTNRSTAARALEVYDSVRRPIANAIVQRARKNGRLFQFDFPGKFDGTRCGEGEEMRMLKELGDDAYAQFAWVWEEAGPEDVWEHAKEQYERMLGGKSPGEGLD